MTYLPHVIHLVALMLLWRRMGLLGWLLFTSMACSWIVGLRLGGIDRTVGMIMVDLGLILSIRIFTHGARARLIAAISLGLIILRAAYMGVPYMGHTIYAVIVNSAFVLQLLIGGGVADVLGRWIDNRLSRVWPWGARALRYVAV